MDKKFPRPLARCLAAETGNSAETPENPQESLTSLITEYDDCFDPVHGTLKPMTGPNMHIKLTEGVSVRPARTLTARRIPVHLEGEAYEEVQTLIKLGVLRKKSDQRV